MFALMSPEKNETVPNPITLTVPRRAISGRVPAGQSPTFRRLMAFLRLVVHFFPALCSCRYLCSLVETILIYQQFHKPGTEQPSPKQEVVDFWMDFLVEATKRDVSSVRFPVSWRSAGGEQRGGG